MKSYPGGVRPDYKLRDDLAPLTQRRKWSMFALGVLVPMVSVAILLNGETNETVLPATAGLQQASLAGGLGLIALAETPVISSADATVPIAAVLNPPIVISSAAAATTPSALPVESTAANGAPPAPEPVTATVPPPDLLAAAQFDELELIVNRGDSLDALFRRNGLSIANLAEMLQIESAASHLRKLLPGDKLIVSRDGAEVHKLQRELGDAAILSITRTDAGYSATEIAREIETRVVGRHGVIQSSLFEAAMAAEIPDAITMAMIGYLEWDIDFMQDVRVDDRFTVLYEERWREGERLANGRILAAEFVNRGESIRIVRYTDPDGNADYFTPDGRSVRKAFLRAPLNFTRISGSFNPRRRHPILNTIRAHRGVDYAAPTGTPIRAAGDGKIVQRGNNGGYGNSVTLQHGDNITTLYAHMSRFGSPRNGDRVSQGDIIGYVGSTGLATGPHLHYEYRLNGVHRNPRTVELPPADPIPGHHREDFGTASAKLWRQLDAFQSAWVANRVN